MLLVSVSLREVPDRALRLIVTASAHDGSACVLVEVFIGPLPYISDHVHYTERTGHIGMRIHIVRGKHRTALIRNRRRSIAFRSAGNWSAVPGGGDPIAVTPRKAAPIVAQSGYQLGTTAARLLLDRKEGDTSPAKHIILETSLTLRHSVAPPMEMLQDHSTVNSQRLSKPRGNVARGRRSPSSVA